jgi:hypothetical protein
MNQSQRFTQQQLQFQHYHKRQQMLDIQTTMHEKNWQDIECRRHYTTKNQTNVTSISCINRGRFRYLLGNVACAGRCTTFGAWTLELIVGARWRRATTTKSITRQQQQQQQQQTQTIIKTMIKLTCKSLPNRNHRQQRDTPCRSI